MPRIKMTKSNIDALPISESDIVYWDVGRPGFGVKVTPKGVAPHVADKILNHQSGTISGVAAVYQRHEFLAERRAALDLWGAHVAGLLKEAPPGRRIDLRIVA